MDSSTPSAPAREVAQRIVRPKDTSGRDIIMGDWYWATNRTGQLVGTGKFAALIGGTDITFFINGVGYSTHNFTYDKAATPAAPVPSAGGAGEWVKCSERMPDTDRLVIVPGGVARYHHDAWFTETGVVSGRRICWAVTCWMELPAPPLPPSEGEAAR